jgi:hypothetical protein
MDCQDDLARGLVDIGDDVGDQGAQEPLAGAHADARRVPCGFEVVGKPGKVRRDGGRVLAASLPTEIPGAFRPAGINSRAPTAEGEKGADPSGASSITRPHPWRKPAFLTTRPTSRKNNAS